MFIGALIDLGVDAHRLEDELQKLGLEYYHLHVSRDHKASIEGVKFDVHLSHDHHHSSGQSETEAHHAPVAPKSDEGGSRITHHERHEHGHEHHHHHREPHPHEHTHGR